MTHVFTNNAASVLAGAISSSSTSISLRSGDGALFPTLTGGESFLATLVGLDSQGREATWEIVRCTARTNDVLTVQRGQESTNALAWPSGTRIELRLTAGQANNFSLAYSWGNHASVGYLTNVSWNDVSGKPATFTPVAHTHTIANVTGLQDALDDKEPVFAKNSAFNKSFGTAAGTVAQGNDSRINNGQTAYSWGNHASAGYVPSTRSVSTGTGLTGGGTLSANRTLSVSFGTTSTTVARGNDSRIVNGQTAFSWGNHATAGYLTSVTWGDVTGKPATFPPSTHTHSQYVRLDAENYIDAPVKIGIMPQPNFLEGGDKWLSIMGDGTRPAAMTFHRVNAFACHFGLDTDGHMKIGGWSMVTVRHTFRNDGSYIAAGDVTASSDLRLKSDIRPITNALEKTLAINGCTFVKKDIEGRSVGVIAQDVQAVLPEAVKEDSDGYLVVAYGNLVGLLIEAMREQQRQIEVLKEAVNDLAA